MKKKRLVKNREEVLKDLQKSQDFRNKMIFVKNKFYPALIEASRSIDDANSFLSSLSTMMMQKFLGLMKEKKFADLKLTEILDPKDDKYEPLCAMLDLFKDESVFDAKELIEGMRTEVQLFINEEMKSRSLASLETKWIDEK